MTCCHNTDCSIRALWSSVQNAIENLLGKTTLKDLIKPESEMLHWIANRPTAFTKVAAAGAESAIRN